MKLLRQFLILAVICLVSEALVRLLSIPLPGSLISLLLVVVLLCCRILKEEDIKEVADFLLLVMSMLFVPAGIGAAEKIGIILADLWKVLIVILAGILASFFGSYLAASAVGYLMRRHDNG